MIQWWGFIMYSFFTFAIYVLQGLAYTVFTLFIITILLPLLRHFLLNDIIYLNYFLGGSSLMKITKILKPLVIAIALLLPLIILGCNQDTKNNDPSSSNSSSILIQINGVPVETKAKSISLNGEWLVSAFCVFEKIGAHIQWDDEIEQITITMNDNEFILVVDSFIASIGGKDQKLDHPLQVVDSIPMVPIKLLAGNLGMNFSWNEVDKSIALQSPSKILMPYTQALEILAEGVTAQVTDLDTGITYNVKRIGGINHADVETLTLDDTKRLLETYDGEWSLRRRAVIVNVDGIIIAGSMAAMPHSGREDVPFGAVVDNRSGGTGRGINLNSIRDNNMNGVVDIYFYNSIIPGQNRIDERHQQMVLKAAESYDKQ